MAFAQVNNDLAAYREAGSKLMSLVAEAERAPEKKGLESEEIDQLVALLSNEMRFLGTKPHSAKDLENLLELCDTANRTVMSLAMFALKGHVDPTASPQKIASQVAELMNKNVETFGRHLRYLQPFSIRCLARQVPAMTDFVTSLPPALFTDVRRKGLEKFRAGLAHVFVDVVASLGNPNCDEAYRLALLESLADSAPSFISTLPVPVRFQIRSLISPSPGTSKPVFGIGLLKIYHALEDKTCSGLCSI